MFFAKYKTFFVVCLVLLDVLVARNIVTAQASTKHPSSLTLGAHTRRHLLVRKLTPTTMPTPTSTPTPTVSPTPIPPSLAPAKTQPTQTSQVVQQTQNTSSQTPSNNSGGLQNLLDQVNAFRASNGLSAVHSDSHTCSLATTRAGEISSGFDHSGFESRVSSHTLPYPSYSEVTENIAMNSDQSQIVQMWINSPGHNANMRKDTPYVCIANYGSYYAYEGWRP